MTEPEPPAVDLEQARALFADETCPMPDHDDPVPTEVVETRKLTTEDQATDWGDFYGRPVPVRPMMVVRCTAEGCRWGQEIVALPSSNPDNPARTVVAPRTAHAGLGYTSVPPPKVGQ